MVEVAELLEEEVFEGVSLGTCTPRFTLIVLLFLAAFPPESVGDEEDIALMVSQMLVPVLVLVPAVFSSTVSFAVILLFDTKVKAPLARFKTSFADMPFGRQDACWASSHLLLLSVVDSPYFAITWFTLLDGGLYPVARASP